MGSCYWFDVVAGFFTPAALQSSAVTKTGKTASCISCGKYKGCRTPKMTPVGNGKKGILIVSRCPTKEDDRTGTLWNDSEGRYLKQELKRIGVDIYEDCWTTHAVRCRSYDIDDLIVANCRPKLLNFIKKVKPLLIITLGHDALSSVVGSVWKKGVGSVHRWRGYQIPDQTYSAWICPTFDPFLVLRDKIDSAPQQLVKTLFRSDLTKAIQCTKRVQTVDYPKMVSIVDTQDKFRTAIAEIKQGELLSFDYETTGTKPHRKEQAIICTAACVSSNKVFVWMNTPRRNKAWAKVLKSDIPKTAHNFTFEDSWSLVKIGPVKNWDWCTMNGAHILDNRELIVGLKFQVYINFGVASYDEEVAGYLRTTPEEKDKFGANGMNQLQQFVQSKSNRNLVLTYCGLDALFGYLLTIKQKEAAAHAKS